MRGGGSEYTTNLSNVDDMLHHILLRVGCQLLADLLYEELVHNPLATLDSFNVALSFAFRH